MTTTEPTANQLATNKPTTNQPRASEPTASELATNELTSLMNVGPAIARYLSRAGVTTVDDLTGRDPVELYEAICTHDAQRHDPCLLDTIMSAVDQANGNPPRPWWTYTPTRKQLPTRAG